MLDVTAAPFQEVVVTTASAMAPEITLPVNVTTSIWNFIT
jgi:hypothetical protein